MPINVHCENPDCQKPLRVKDELAGKRIKCPACRHPMDLPGLGDAPPPPQTEVQPAAPPRPPAAATPRNRVPKERKPAEDRPASRRKARSSSTPKLVITVVGLVVAGVVGYFLVQFGMQLYSNMKEQSPSGTPVANASRPGSNSAQPSTPDGGSNGSSSKPAQSPAKDDLSKNPAALARLYFGDNLEKRPPGVSGFPVKDKDARDAIEKKLLGLAVDWEGQVLIDFINKKDRNILMVPFSESGWIWVSEITLQDQLNSLPLGSRVRITMKLNAPILAIIAADGVPVVILGGDEARLSPRANQ